MRYFVLAEDGKKYGPAETALLNQWIGEGRLLPDMQLEEEGTHHPVVAASVSELDFYALEGAGKGTFDGTMFIVAEGVHVEPQETVEVDLILAFAAAGFALLLAFTTPIISLIGVMAAVLGLAAAFKAKDRGHPAGSAALAMNMCALAVWAIVRALHMLIQR